VGRGDARAADAAAEGRGVDVAVLHAGGSQTVCPTSRKADSVLVDQT
jgi:hypothetical protein